MKRSFWVIQAFWLIIAFLLIINGSIGWALIYALAGALTLSALCCFLSRNNFSVEVTNLSGSVNNGAQAEIQITIRKTGFCFAPHILIYFEKHSLLIDMPLLFSKECTHVTTIPMPESGLCEIRPSKILVCGFFRTLRLTPKGEPPTNSAFVSVLPAIIPYVGEEIRPKTLPCDDEDAEESVVTQSSGLLGCEHRPYVNGDPMRSIDYKLSAKHGELMVRLCESSGTAPTIILIEPSGHGMCADAAFSIARDLITRGGSVRVIHGENNFHASTPQTLERLREWLSQEKFFVQNDTVHSFNHITPNADVVLRGQGEIILK